MCLHIDTDAAYLVTTNSKSRVAGYFYLSDRPSPHKSTPMLNALIHVECCSLRHIVSSAAESETAGIFTNCQTVIPIRHMLNILGHPQPPTPVKTDNKTAAAFSNDTLKPKRIKAWDMRYHWIKDRTTQNQYIIYWEEGLKNFTDYFTKHFSPSYRQNICSTYILQGHNMSSRNVSP